MQKLKKLYAKSIDENGAKTTLIKHLRDVTIQICEFIKLYEKELLEIDNEIDFIRILVYSAFMHDFGKVHPDFQAQLSEEKDTYWGQRHEILSLAFVNYLKVPEKELPYLLAGIGLHHKDLFRIKEMYYGKIRIKYSEYQYNLTSLSQIPQEIINELKDFLCGNFLSKFIKKYEFNFIPYEFNTEFNLIPEKISKEILNHIETINSNYESFIEESYEAGIKDIINTKNVKLGIMARGLVLSSDHLASANKSYFLLSKGVSNLLELFNIFPMLKNLRPHQKTISEKIGNTILIAPTGSGKTESSLLWAIKQKEENKTNGRLFILLPYRASMNAMSKRLGNTFGEKEISLVHGKSLITAYNNLMEQNYNKKEAVKMAREKETLARMNTAPIRISSPYNLFKPFFGSKGYEANLTNMINANIIFDEIHAYDTKITGFALASAKYMCDMFNANILFMSATMPSHLQEVLKEKFNIKEIIKPDNDFLSKNIRHKLMLHENLIDDSIENIIFEAQNNNKSVLVVSNTVDKAINIYNQIKQKYDDIILLHSRFTSKDRAEKEEKLKPQKGKILVATQVVEVSLDIDYDTCFTEIAPFEALLQRFGRVNRHALREPAIVNVFSGNKNTDKVYDNSYLCKTYETLLSVNNSIISETLVQELLDKSYPEDLKTKLKNDVEETFNNFKKNFIDELTPYGVQNIDILDKLRKDWDNLFDGYEIIPKSIYEKEIKGKWINSIDMSGYLIPISSGRFFGLNKNNLITKDEKGNFIFDDSNNKYDNQVGLSF
ncbi:MAG: CRISPR-associated helicase Cas3' [Candidatus Sericytochromatia bacterium]